MDLQHTMTYNDGLNHLKIFWMSTLVPCCLYRSWGRPALWLWSASGGHRRTPRVWPPAPAVMATLSSCWAVLLLLLWRLLLLLLLSSVVGRSGHLQGGVSPPRNCNIYTFCFTIFMICYQIYPHDCNHYMRTRYSEGAALALPAVEPRLETTERGVKCETIAPIISH